MGDMESLWHGEDPGAVPYSKHFGDGGEDEFTSTSEGLSEGDDESTASAWEEELEDNADKEWVNVSSHMERA